MAEPVKKGMALKRLGLDDQDGHAFRLADSTGRQVMLSFHPLVWASGCVWQAQPWEESKKALDRFNAVALGLGSDRLSCKVGRTKSPGTKTRALVSDSWPRGAFAKSLGFLQIEGISERAYVILDESGQILSVLVCSTRQFPDTGKSWRP